MEYEIKIMHYFYLVSSVLETALEINNFSKNLIIHKYPAKLIDPINDDGKYYIMLNGKVVNCGSIVCRPLSFSVVNKVASHFAVVLGTNDKGEELFLECTTNFHVRMINKKVFLDRYAEEKAEIYSDLNIPVQTILDRANHYYYTRYSLLDFNCYDFANYCTYEIEPYERSKVLDIFNQHLKPIKIFVEQQYLKSIGEMP